MPKCVVETSVGNTVVVTSGDMGARVLLFTDDSDCPNETISESCELVSVDTIGGEYMDAVDEGRCVCTGLIIELMASVTAVEVFNGVFVCVSHSTTLVVVLRAKEQDSRKMYQSFASILVKYTYKQVMLSYA